MAGFTFAPTSRTYDTVRSDQIDQDFAPSVVAGVDDDIDELLPNRFGLAQNYPNPFNPVTTICFALPKQSLVTIYVFNISGQRVATLARGRMEAGEYSIQWDGLDDGGESVTTGVYFYRLHAGDFVQTRKMLLLK
jgi:hypothetical protein